MGRAKNIPAKDALLLPYQAAWVADQSRLKIAEKSRQIGWTWATAYGLVRRKALRGAKRDAWISSRDDIQARLFLEDCKGFAGLLQTGARDLGEKAVDDDGHSAYVLGMANGLRIHSMSSNPDAQAGKRGDRVLDEFALHPDPRKLYSIAYPGITWGGSLEIFSTHRGTGNFFNQLLEEAKHKGNPKGFSLHRVTLENALDQGFLHKLQGALPAEDPRQEMDEAEYFDFIKSGCADEETFAQEYMCVPSDDASAFIEWALLDRAKLPVPPAGLDALPRDAKVWLGVDVARKKDLFAIWAAVEEAGMLVPAEVRTLRGESYAAMECELYGIMDEHDVVRCCVDATGIGNQFAERAQARYGWKVEPVIFTAATKESMAYALRGGMEDGRFRIPDDPRVFADFRGVRKTVSPAGTVRFDAARTEAGHSDIFWSAALCNAAHEQAAAWTDPRFVGAGRGGYEERRI